MDMNSRFQQMALAGQGQKLGLSQVRPSRPVVVVPSSGQERTYMNVNPATVASGSGIAGQVQMIDNSHGFVSRFDTALFTLLLSYLRGVEVERSLGSVSKARA